MQSLIIHDAMILVALVMGVALGFLLNVSIVGVRRSKVPDPYREEEETVKVKRTKPSLRNPMRTYNAQYDDFKTKRGLYEPVKPRGRTREQEDELEV